MNASIAAEHYYLYFPCTFISSVQTTTFFTHLMLAIDFQSPSLFPILCLHILVKTLIALRNLKIVSSRTLLLNILPKILLIRVNLFICCFLQPTCLILPYLSLFILPCFYLTVHHFITQIIKYVICSSHCCWMQGQASQ